MPRALHAPRKGGTSQAPRKCLGPAYMIGPAQPRFFSYSPEAHCELPISRRFMPVVWYFPLAPELARRAPGPRAPPPRSHSPAPPPWLAQAIYNRAASLPVCARAGCYGRLARGCGKKNTRSPIITTGVVPRGTVPLA
jgi:hypothetical protein